jgi:hypothetical protein
MQNSVTKKLIQAMQLTILKRKMQAASIADEVLIQLGENVHMYIRTRAKPNIRVNLKGNAKYVYHQ